jgi:hypothetical protein
MKKTINELITEHFKEKYRKKRNSTKALKKSYMDLKGIFMDTVIEENPDLKGDELKIIKQYFDEFLSEEEFML